MYEKIDISKGWLMCSKNQLFRSECDLPSENYAELVKMGYIKDPFTETEEKDVAWAAELDWIYKKTFTVEKNELTHKSAVLTFDRIDTVADVLLNGETVASVFNAHIAHSFDVTGKLKEGENEISVYLHSPVKYVREKQKEDPMPKHFSGISGYSHIRKPACHFGWDWGPILPVSGLGDHVYITFGNGPKIESVRAESQIFKDAAEISINTSMMGKTSQTKVVYTLYSPSGKEIIKKEAGEKDGGYISCFTVENPERWECNGLYQTGKKQPLYTLKTEAYENGVLSDIRTEKIGIRDIKLSTAKDQYGSDFCFIVNGARIFAKGANWIPPDSFISRAGKSVLEGYIKAAAESGFNMIRVWGGGYYASDDFLDLCDEYGILVWQDFMFACAPYPFYDSAFLRSTLEEAAYNVKRIRNHACIALFCGNNEIEAMQPGWMNRKKLIDASADYFYSKLPPVVSSLTSVPYWPGSPGSGEFNKNIGSDDVGDTHIWSVWHGMMPFTSYLKRKTRFCSEFGFESLPSMETVKEFAPLPSDRRMRSAVMQAHQKCPAGNERILYYMSDRYRIPKDFEHLVYLSQLTQAESIAYAVNFWRRNLRRCNGSLYWQFNDCWHTASWSSIDYRGRYKALQYFAKRFFRPVGLAVMKDKKRMTVSVINDSAASFTGTLVTKIAGFDGTVRLHKEICVLLKPYSVIEAEAFYLKGIEKKEKSYILAELFDEKGVSVFRESELFVNEKSAALKKAALSFETSAREDSITIKLTANGYARRVMLEAEGVKAPFSDNFFDMEKGETRLITLPLSCGLNAVEIQTRLKATTFSDIVPRYTLLRERVKRLKILLMPKNLFGKIVQLFA